MIITALSLIVSVAQARTDVFFEAGHNKDAPAAAADGQTLGWGATVSQWNYVPPAADGALHFDFGFTKIGETSEQTIALLNGGDAPATQLQIEALTAPYAFKGGKFPGEGGSCGEEIAAKGSCTLIITHTPTELGYYAGQVSAKFHDGDEEGSIALRLGGYGEDPNPAPAQKQETAAEPEATPAAPESAPAPAPAAE